MRKTLILAGGLALALTLGACADKTTGGTPNGSVFSDAQSLVRAASESTAEKKSAKLSMDMKLGPVDATAEGSGIFDGANSKMAITMSMDMSAAGMGDMDIEMRMLDDAMYLKMPPETPGADPEKPWMKLDLDELAAESGMDMNQMIEQNDPTKMLELLKESGDIVSTDENAKVDGQPATKYTINVDFAKLMEQYGASAGDMVDVGELDIDTMPMEVWINADNLPVQFVIDMGDAMQKVMDASGESMPPGMSFEDASITAKYTDWGTPVTIEAPPESEIGEAGLPS